MLCIPATKDDKPKISQVLCKNKNPACQPHVTNSRNICHRNQALSSGLQNIFFYKAFVLSAERKLFFNIIEPTVRTWLQSWHQKYVSLIGGRAYVATSEGVLR